MNKKAFATAVASVAVAGTIAAPAMADETATTPVEQAQQAVEQAQQAVDQAAAQPTTQPQQDQVAAAQQAVTDAKTTGRSLIAWASACAGGVAMARKSS